MEISHKKAHKGTKIILISNGFYFVPYVPFCGNSFFYFVALHLRLQCRKANCDLEQNRPWHRNRVILRGGGSRSALKSARLAANRTHIKLVTTVSIVTPTSVPYAYRNLKLTIHSAPVVVNSNKEVSYGSARNVER
jgi:hypothetical protein